MLDEKESLPTVASNLRELRAALLAGDFEIPPEVTHADFERWAGRRTGHDIDDEESKGAADDNDWLKVLLPQ